MQTIYFFQLEEKRTKEDIAITARQMGFFSLLQASIPLKKVFSPPNLNKHLILKQSIKSLKIQPKQISFLVDLLLLLKLTKN